MTFEFEIIIAAVVGVLGYAANNRLERAKMRSDATFEMLRTITFQDGPIYQANLKLMNWIAEDHPLEFGKLIEEDKRAVMEILNFFHLIADAAERNVVDKDMVIEHLGGRMKQGRYVLGGYIKDRRDSLNRQGLYRPLDAFLESNDAAISKL